MVGEASKYLCGVIREAQVKRFGSLGIGDGNSEVYTIPYQEIAGVVSDTRQVDFSSLLKETLAQFLVKHQAMIEQVMKTHTVIPVKFGTFLESEESVKGILRKGYPRLQALLGQMEGKIELDLVATWRDVKQELVKISQEDPKIRQFKEAIEKKPPDKGLQDRIAIGVMLKEALDQKRGQLQVQMLELLKAQAERLQPHDLMNDEMVLNCACLIDRGREEQFDRALHDLDSQFQGEINFRCVGPLPPYSFSTIEIKRADPAGLEAARALFGFGEEAKAQEIQERYRRLVRERHPDRSPGDAQAQERFEELQAAYQTLIEYCQGEKASFRKEEVRDSFIITLLDLTGTRA